MPSVLTIDLYNGLLFSLPCPVDGAARGPTSSAAIVSASLSNILGVMLSPLLVVLLMNTSGALRVDGTAIRDIVLQLLLPFGASHSGLDHVAADDLPPDPTRGLRSDHQQTHATG